MTRALPVSQEGFRAWLARAFIAAVALTVIGYGAASTVQVNLAAFGFAILAILSTFHPIGSWQAGRAQAVSIFVLAGLVGYAAFQTLPLPGLDLANGAWKSVSENIGPVNGTISVAPGTTLDALTTLALPFLAFIAELVFFQGDDEALWLWRALAYFGAAYAAFGILQELLFPDQLLFETKKYYVGFLTATFVNRNTAGTFFGIALLLNLGLEFHELRKIRIASFIKKALDFAIGWRDKNVLVLVHAFCCLIIAMALFLTQSRGAVGATFIACVGAVALMSTRRLTADKPGEEFVAWRRYATIIAGLLVVVGLFALFAGRSVTACRNREAKTRAGAPSPRRSRRSETIGSSARGSAPSRTYFLFTATPIAPESSAFGIEPTISSWRAGSGSACRFSPPWRSAILS